MLLNNQSQIVTLTLQEHPEKLAKHIVPMPPDERKALAKRLIAEMLSEKQNPPSPPAGRSGNVD